MTERLRAAQMVMQAAAEQARAVRGALDHAVIEGPSSELQDHAQLTATSFLAELN